MSRHTHYHYYRRSHPILGIIGALILIGLIVKLWPLLVVVAVTYVALRFGVYAYRKHRERESIRWQRAEAIRARADWQHAAYMAGDPRGTYGDYPPGV